MMTYEDVVIPINGHLRQYLTIFNESTGVDFVDMHNAFTAGSDLHLIGLSVYRIRNTVSTLRDVTSVWFAGC